MGASNLLSGELAQRLLGAPGEFIIRPEKISVLPAGAAAADGARVADGKVAEVAYLGALSRVKVELEGGGALTAVVQNVEAGHREVAKMQGQPVRLSWRREHARALESGAAP